MITFLKIFQLVVSLLLIIAILVQNRGSGLSAALGGGGDSITTTKRGAEKVVYRATIVLAIVFVLNSVAFIFV
ncbi:preprotein translocase subunit SecG [Pseudomonadota bacterium]